MTFLHIIHLVRMTCVEGCSHCVTWWPCHVPLREFHCKVSLLVASIETTLISFSEASIFWETQQIYTPHGSHFSPFPLPFKWLKMYCGTLRMQSCQHATKQFIQWAHISSADTDHCNSAQENLKTAILLTKEVDLGNERNENEWWRISRVRYYADHMDPPAITF